MKPFLQSLFLSLCLTAGLAAQDHHFQLYGGLGQSSLFKAQSDNGLGGVLSLEYHRSLNPKTGFFVAFGSQYTNYEDQSITSPCDFILGDKVVFFNTTEFYELHRTDLTLSLGLTHQIGKFILRGSLLPTMRLSDQIDARLVQNFNNPNRPSRAEEYSIKPGQRFNPNGPLLNTIDYSDNVQLQGEIGLTFAIEKQLHLGIAYRHGLTQYELQYKTIGEFCGAIPPCEISTNINSRVDARTGHGYITMGYTF